MSAPALTHTALCSAATLGVYAGARHLHARVPRLWSMPVLMTPMALAAGLLVLGVGYRQYAAGTGWLTRMLGPATVAFAVPIYEQRALIRARWRVLLVAAIGGSLTAIATSWGLASALDLDGTLRASLLPRSTSTPFAMAISERIGGIPELTAVFVVGTGILGALLGELWLARLRVRSSLARGAALGVAAHGVGTARAYQVGPTEGAVAALAMVAVGVLNVLAAPLLAEVLS